MVRSSKRRRGRLLASESEFAGSTGQLPRLHHNFRLHLSVQVAGNQPPATVDANLHIKRFNQPTILDTLSERNGEITTFQPRELFLIEVQKVLYGGVHRVCSGFLNGLRVVRNFFCECRRTGHIFYRETLALEGERT